jgi:hypothetical protein
LRTTEYVNIPNAMFALEEKLNKNLDEN